MSRWHPQRVFILLAVFVIGGLVAPVVHRIQHNTLRIHDQEAPVQFPDSSSPGPGHGINTGSDAPTSCSLCDYLPVLADLKQDLSPAVGSPSVLVIAPIFSHLAGRFSTRSARAPPVSLM